MCPTLSRSVTSRASSSLGSRIKKSPGRDGGFLARGGVPCGRAVPRLKKVKYTMTTSCCHSIFSGYPSMCRGPSEWVGGNVVSGLGGCRGRSRAMRYGTGCGQDLPNRLPDINTNFTICFNTAKTVTYPL